MKKVILSVFIMCLVACKKSGLGKTCWDCEVQRMNGTKYNERVCRDDNLVPQFEDSNGNDLSAFCTKR